MKQYKFLILLIVITLITNPVFAIDWIVKTNKNNVTFSLLSDGTITKTNNNSLGGSNYKIPEDLEFITGNTAYNVYIDIDEIYYKFYKSYSDNGIKLTVFDSSGKTLWEITGNDNLYTWHYEYIKEGNGISSKANKENWNKYERKRKKRLKKKIKKLEKKENCKYIDKIKTKKMKNIKKYMKKYFSKIQSSKKRKKYNNTAWYSEYENIAPNKVKEITNETTWNTTYYLYQNVNGSTRYKFVIDESNKRIDYFDNNGSMIAVITPNNYQSHTLPDLTKDILNKIL